MIPLLREVDGFADTELIRKSLFDVQYKRKPLLEPFLLLKSGLKKFIGELTPFFT
jgi:hypothetical protein